MKRLKSIFSLLMVFLCVTCMARADGGALIRYVNPWIGTGGHGHVFLGANVPFGFIQLGPTEHTRGWDWCSGYHVSDSILIGFGHLHLSGTVIGELGDVAFLPVADHCVAEVARMLRHHDDYRYFHQRSLAYRHYFDKKTGFIRK